MAMKWVQSGLSIECKKLPEVSVSPGKVLATVYITWEAVSALPLEEAKKMAELIHPWAPQIPPEEALRAAYLRAGGKLYTATQVVELLRQHQEEEGDIPRIPFFPHMGDEEDDTLWVTQLVAGNYHVLKTEFSILTPLNAAEMGATVEKDSGGTPYLAFQGYRVEYECERRTINSFCR